MSRSRKMGIIYSFFSFSGKKTEDEEAQRSSYPNQNILDRQSCDTWNGYSTFKKVLKIMSSFPSLFCSTLKGTLQVLQTINLYFSKPRKLLVPLLPLENPAQKTIDHIPSLIQSHVIISETSNTFSSPSVHSTEENEPPSPAQKTIDHIPSLIQNHVIISETSNTFSSPSVHSTDENEPPSPEQVKEDQSITGVLSSVENEERERKKVVIKSMVVAEARWINHYSSRHRILIVGDGDFSFSASLALAFGCASNMIATSLDSSEFLKQNYKKATSNLVALTKRGCKVMHGIDATEMANHSLLRNIMFDRIIYNFPFAGFYKGLSRKSVLRRHRRLVSLFLKNGKEMIGEIGEIHISHKTNGFHNEWNLVSMASSHGLKLIEEVEFDLDDYPGYNTKRGFGGDDNFDCYPSSTYKFGLKSISY